MKKEIQKEDLMYSKAAWEALKVNMAAAPLNMAAALLDMVAEAAMLMDKVVAPWEVAMNSKVMVEVQ